MISPNTIQQILGRIDIVDIIGGFVKLKKRGTNFLGLCPFHNEKTPSFTVSPGKEIYKCFGCGRSGNAISFLMEHEKYSYVEALRWLANKYNVEIEETESASANARLIPLDLPGRFGHGGVGAIPPGTPRGANRMDSRAGPCRHCSPPGQRI